MKPRKPKGKPDASLAEYRRAKAKLRGVPTREETKAIRKLVRDTAFRDLALKVLTRAQFVCECCCAWLPFTGEIDHWLGGSGRRRQRESIETIWLLCSSCHADRTANRPSVEHWNERFRLHCERYGYPFVPHLEKPRRKV